MGSKQTKEQAEQDLTSFSAPITTSLPETAATTIITPEEDLITQESFFAQVQAKLIACAELPSITIADISACFATPPASKYEGHAINKFTACLKARLLRRFITPSSGEESLLRTRVLQLSVNTISSSGLAIRMTLDPLSLQIPVRLSFNNTYEYEIKELAFKYELDCITYPFDTYRLLLHDLAVTGNLVVSGGGERKSQSAHLSTHYEVSITPRSAITVTSSVDQGTPLIRMLLDAVENRNNNQQLLLEKTDVEARFRHSVSVLHYKEKKHIWEFSIDATFMAGHRPSTCAVSSSGEKTMQKMKSFTIQNTILSVRFFLGEEEEQGMVNLSSSFASYDILVSFHNFTNHLSITTPCFDEMDRIFNQGHDHKPISRRIPLLRYLRPKILRSLIKTIGKLEAMKSSEIFVSTLDALPDFLLDNFGAVYSISFPICQSHGRPELTCLMGYHPNVVETGYNFFQMIANLTVAGHGARLTFSILTPLLDLRNPINTVVQVTKMHSTWSTNNFTIKGNLSQILRRGRKFMTPIGKYSEELWTYRISSAEIQFSPSNGTLQFNLSGERCFTLLFDLNRGEATLQDPKHPSNLVRFTLHRAKRKPLTYERLFTETKLRDISILFT